jgi:omega-6 fatty acid desaturase (delta-12 desaturase)
MDFETEKLRALHARSSFKGTALFLFDLSIFITTVLACVVVDSFWWKATYSILAGVMTSLLFVVGHDACHQSLTPHRWLNRLLGTLAFLPALHPYSAWELSHNRIHHRYTNRRGKDFAWEPLTYAEFWGLSRFQRLKYRFFRTFFGHFWYYLYEVWWKKIFFPPEREVGKYTREFVLDHITVSAWLVIWPGAIMALTWLVSGGSAGIYELGLSALVCCFGPFLVFNLLISSVIYLHHMHPKVGWVPGDIEVDPRRMQLLSSVHVVFPHLTNLVFHRIMEHTAHHLRPGIPLYNLQDGQSVLETTYPEVIVHKWSPWSHLDTLARCKLFELESRCWTGYDGVPTAAPIDAQYFEDQSRRKVA